MTTDNTYPQERLCTVLSYYDYRQYILSRKVYVQFTLIMTRDIIPQERLCTVLSYYDCNQYKIPRNVYVQFLANTSFPVTFMYSTLLL
jgi:hypothetical protein